jgi:divalent metal cation (Fe/Co/Zn/Cd) transporter
VISAAERSRDLRRGLHLEYFSLGYNALEAFVGIAAGLLAGSVALIGFGLDSIVEASSALILLWRLRAEASGARTSEEAEVRAVRLVAVAFLVLAAYVGVSAIVEMTRGTRPQASPLGVVLAITSLVVMPLLARRKRDLARELGSRSLDADSRQTLLCTYLSAVLLFGLVTNSLFGWWWADPVAALVIGGLAANEGIELWRHREAHTH